MIQDRLSCYLASWAFLLFISEHCLRDEGKPLFGSLSTRQADCLGALVRFAAVCNQVFQPDIIKKHCVNLLSGKLVIPLHRNCFYNDLSGLFMPDNFDGLLQERSNSSALAMELCLSCTNSSISHTEMFSHHYLSPSLYKVEITNELGSSQIAHSQLIQDDVSLKWHIVISHHWHQGNHMIAPLPVK